MRAADRLVIDLPDGRRHVCRLFEDAADSWRVIGAVAAVMPECCDWFVVRAGEMLPPRPGTVAA